MGETLAGAACHGRPRATPGFSSGASRPAFPCRDLAAQPARWRAPPSVAIL